MGSTLGLHPRLVLALLRDRPDPLLHQPAGFGSDLHDTAIFPCEPALMIPWGTVKAMLSRGLIEAVAHEGSAGRVAYVAHPAALDEAYSTVEAERHKGTIACWHRSYAKMAARGQPHPLHRKVA